MFYCNPFDHFLAAEGDASASDIADAPFPNNRWYTLNFHHQSTLSRLDLGGGEPYLAGNGRRFIDQLGINSWRNPEPDAPTSTGLAGNLALLIGLVVFSCKSHNMDNVLRNVWRAYEWRGHNHSHGRTVNPLGDSIELSLITKQDVSGEALSFQSIWILKTPPSLLPLHSQVSNGLVDNCYLELRGITVPTSFGIPSLFIWAWLPATYVFTISYDTLISQSHHLRLWNILYRLQF